MGEQLVRTDRPLEEASRIIVDGLVAWDRQKGRARFAVAAGSALDALRHVVPAVPDDVWSRTRLVWADERCVPFDSPDSNAGKAHRDGILTDAKKPEIELKLWRDGDTADKAIRRAKKHLYEEFADRLDVALLSAGEDGHVASLFPGHPAKNVRGTVVHLADSPKPPPERITLTLELLRTAQVAVVLVLGEKKRPVLDRFIAGDTDLVFNYLPNVTVVTDLK